jgi:hypothetical protein
MGEFGRSGPQLPHDEDVQREHLKEVDHGGHLRHRRRPAAHRGLRSKTDPIELGDDQGVTRARRRLDERHATTGTELALDRTGEEKQMSDGGSSPRRSRRR